MLLNLYPMKKLIGTIPKESDFISRFRSHQGWWRTFVLNEEEGTYWDKSNNVLKKVCNRLNNGMDFPQKNFLSDEIREEVISALKIQEVSKSGIMDKDRLYNNLLSSQPLAFNFYGFFKSNPDVALAFVQSLKPEITSVEDIVFEFSPKSSGDNSAFDFGFIVNSSIGKGFIGFECKYTDTFSYKRPKTGIYYGDTEDKNYEKYHELYSINRDRLPDDYSSYILDQHFNQLFRNELLGIQLKSDFDFVITGLFCHHEDVLAVNAGKLFQKKIGNRDNDFILLTYQDYFNTIQKLELSWELRELVMMLWARYCGLKLSKEIIS